MARRIANYVPRDIREQLDRFSKAALMELVWDYALGAVGDSAEDQTENPQRLADIQERAGDIKSLYLKG